MNNITGNIHVTGEIEAHVPPDLAKKRDAAEKKQEARDKLRFGVEVAGLVFVIIYAGLTLWMSYSAYRSAKAAMNQATTSASQLEMSERPWISFVALKDSPLHFDQFGLTLKLKFDLRNTGLTPATHVFTDVEFIPITGDQELFATFKKNACLIAEKDSASSEVTVFPGADSVEERKFFLGIQNVDKFTSHGFVMLNVIVCVAYESTDDPSKHYSSGAQIYRLTRITPIGEEGIVAHQDVPVDDLRVYPFGQTATLVVGGNYQIGADDSVIINNDSAASPPTQQNK